MPILRRKNLDHNSPSVSSSKKNTQNFSLKMEKVIEDMVLASSVQHHGLENWKMMAVKFSNFIPNGHRCILQFSYVECQVEYKSLKRRSKCLYQTLLKKKKKKKMM